MRLSLSAIVPWGPRFPRSTEPRGTQSRQYSGRSALGGGTLYPFICCARGICQTRLTVPREYGSDRPGAAPTVAHPPSFDRDRRGLPPRFENGMRDCRISASQVVVDTSEVH